MGILRLLFAVSVVINHTNKSLFNNSLVGGALAVQSFFVISGFYMSLILNEKYAKKSYFLFITNRLLRIYPVYWVALIANIVLLYFFYYNQIDKSQLVDHFITHIGIFPLYSSFANIIKDFTLLVRIDYLDMLFKPFKNSLLLTQAWTLVIEFLFYFISPLLVKRSLKFGIYFTVICYFARLVIYEAFRKTQIPISDMFFPAELYFFMLGIIAYKIYFKVKSSVRINRGISFFLLLFFLGISIYYFQIPDFFYKYISVKEQLYPILVAAFIPYFFIQTGKLSMDRFLGNLSYPIYISHTFFIMLIGGFYNSLEHSTWYSPVVVAITTIGSIILYFLVDRPIDRFRQKRAANDI